MCGIVGYIGKKNAFPIIFSGLKRVLYRGYDSFGWAIMGEDGKIKLFKKAGNLNLWQGKFEEIEGNLGIAHTRWATHGKVSDENAHPHFDCQKNIFLVHNGIIENYKELKEKLEKEGHKFVSETDTEVLAHLIEKYFQENLETAVKKALKEVRGTYGLLVISERDPQKIVFARLSSPLLLGVGEKEYFLASDATAILPYTKKVISLEDFEIGVVKKEGFSIFKEDQVQKKRFWEIDWEVEKIQKGGYPHFMLKEIFEIPEATKNSILGRMVIEEGMVKLGGLDSVSERLKEIEKIFLIACGTSFHAAKIGELMLKEYAKIETQAELASEIRYKAEIFNKKTAGIFISQSGETADTLAALREFNKKGILTLGITNVIGSSQARETVAGVYLRAGPEIAVASTKAFLAQICILALLTVYFGRQREMSLVMAKRILLELEKIPKLTQKLLKKAPEIEKIAKKYKRFENFFVVGRKYNFPVALEGALKLKEVACVHGEGIAGGELKHGPLSLVDENLLTIALCPSDSVYEKMVLCVQEIKARKGKVLAIATEGNKEIKKFVDDVIFVPKTLEMLSPLLTVIPLYLFSYYLAILKKRDPDFCRNLAKSVTVE